MNEVSSTQVHTSLTSRAVTSLTGTSVAERVNSDGNNLPIAKKEDVKPEQKEDASTREKASPEDLDQAVSTLNGYVQSIERDLHFTVDSESERTVIKVVDSDSGDVIRQIPEDVFLELARNLKQDGQIQLVDAIG